VPGFFQKLGFQEVDREDLPLKAWKDCLRCPKFQCCDEIAMVKYLRGQAEAVGAAGGAAEAGYTDTDNLLIRLPVIKK